MRELQQDTMSYVRMFGRPDFFITVTMSSTHHSITSSLLPGQVAADRPDLVARAFNVMTKDFKRVMVDGKIFGEVRAFVIVTEYQKRGLPHIHCLFWMTPEDKPQPLSFDEFISAEIPSADADPELHTLVKTVMRHGPCGAENPNSPCMVNGRCSKGFPREFLRETRLNDDGYPSMRRRSPADGGNTAVVAIRGRNVTIDNRWVVPYNPKLLQLFKCHLNVELCNSVHAIKYVVKYILKGGSRQQYSIEREGEERQADPEEGNGGGERRIDEVKEFHNSRSVCPAEAASRLFEHKLNERGPTVTRLPVHLQDRQRVSFKTKLK